MEKSKIIGTFESNFDASVKILRFQLAETSLELYVYAQIRLL